MISKVKRMHFCILMNSKFIFRMKMNQISFHDLLLSNFSNKTKMIWPLISRLK